jgi:hypothetical protein
MINKLKSKLNLKDLLFIVLAFAVFMLLVLSILYTFDRLEYYSGGKDTYEAEEFGKQ